MTIGAFLPAAMADTGSGVALRRLRRDDLSLVGGWLLEPHVRAWWGTPESALPQILGHLDRPDIAPYLIAESERPIGYLQAYHANADAFWTAFGVPVETIGLDLFLGPPDSLRRGFGSAAIRVAIDNCLREPRIRRVQIDPAPENARAIETYRRCGFTAHDRHSGPYGVFIYMTLDLVRVPPIMK